MGDFLRFLFDQITAAGGGLILGMLTFTWLNALWLWWHPQKVRYWGTWYTDPRLLTASGILLAIGWLMLIFKP